MIIDAPPGTGDEPLSVCQLIGDLDGAVVVTTPQKLAAVDVRKSITFCRRLQVPVLGVVENMSGFACPKCGEVTPVLGSGGGRRIAEDMGVPFLGSIPMDPRVAESCDSGNVLSRPAPQPALDRIMAAIAAGIEKSRGGDLPSGAETGAAVPAGDGNPGPGVKAAGEEADAQSPESKESRSMKIAIPLAGQNLAAHFGHCERFALVEADPEKKEILRRVDIDAPPHQPGLLPAWLAERGATVIIAGGMGQRAQDLFSANGIQVIIGAPSETPERLVASFLAGTLSSGENLCDH